MDEKDYRLALQEMEKQRRIEERYDFREIISTYTLLIGQMHQWKRKVEKDGTHKPSLDFEELFDNLMRDIGYLDCVQVEKVHS